MQLKEDLKNQKIMINSLRATSTTIQNEKDLAELCSSSAPIVMSIITSIFVLSGSIANSFKK